MDNGENAWMHEMNTYAKRDAHDDMIRNADDDMAKCNTQENDMATTANN